MFDFIKLLSVRRRSAFGGRTGCRHDNGPALELVASSGASLRLEAIEGETISVDVSSGAEIEVAEGTCGALAVDMSSGAILDMENVECSQVEVDAKSGSTVGVYAEQSIDANASSAQRSQSMARMS